jgi:hypothetical protein
MTSFFNVSFDSGESFIWQAKSKEQIYKNCGNSILKSGGRWHYPKPLRVSKIGFSLEEVRG